MNPRIDQYGNQSWYNEQGLLHRTDGPASTWATGDQVWYFNGEYHRTDGPAVIHSDGYQSYFIHGKRHRTNGPAIIYPNGVKQYYIHDNLLTEEEFNDITQSPEHLNWYLLKIL